MTPAPRLRPDAAETGLAVLALNWAVTLLWPGPSFLAGSGFARAEDALGGEGVLASIVIALAVLKVGGVLFERWPPRARIAGVALGSVLWLFVTVEAFLGRPQTPTYGLAAFVAGMSLRSLIRLIRARETDEAIQQARTEFPGVG